MTISMLRLPTEIPWERICVSRDMLDSQICDTNFPPKWYSSIAVFKYTPPADYQEHPTADIVYLKVAVTITGYQPPESEIEGTLDWDGLDVDAIEAVEDLLNEYHPCTGAIVQVAVAAQGGAVADPENGPYFVDYQPKSRELYEMGSDTKERMSRSLDTLNVGKSAMTAQSTEVLDVDMGGSASLALQGPLGIGGSISGSMQGQWGTKQLGSNESAVARSTDQTSERRETTSMTTQLTQMYHLLNSYHLGTNRIVFFVQPRPHTVAVPSGFVRGPRQVEGVQEFFLIVAKPKTIPDICVSVRLDTAHLAEVPIMDYQYRNDSVSASVAAAPPERDETGSLTFDGYEYVNVGIGDLIIGQRRYACYVRHNEASAPYIPPWSDFKIDLGASGGYQVVDQSVTNGGYSVEVAPDGGHLNLRVWCNGRRCFDDGGVICLDCPPSMSEASGSANVTLRVNLKSREPIVQTGTQMVLLVTTRGVCCCPTAPAVAAGEPAEGVLDVRQLDVAIAKQGTRYGLADATLARSIAATEPASGRFTIHQANALSDLIRDELTAAVGIRAPERRKPVPYTKTDFFLNKLEAKLRRAERVRKQGSKALAPHETLKKNAKKVEEHFKKPLDKLVNRDIAAMPVQELARMTGLTPGEAADVRRQALGFPAKKKK